MAPSTFHRPQVRTAAGFTLTEALLAMLLMAACLVPAAYALRDAVHGPGDNALAARNLDCVASLMETVTATPYDVLYALNNANGPAAYPIPDDPNCPARQVTIQRYGTDATGRIGPGGTSLYLLYVNVSLANAADGDPFTLVTLVSR